MLVLTLIVVQIQQFKYQTVCNDTLSSRVSNTPTWTCSLTATVDKLKINFNFLFVLGLRMFILKFMCLVLMFSSLKNAVSL